MQRHCGSKNVLTHVSGRRCHVSSVGSTSDGTHRVFCRDAMFGPILAIDSQDGDVVLVLPKYAAVLRSLYVCRVSADGRHQCRTMFDACTCACAQAKVGQVKSSPSAAIECSQEMRAMSCALSEDLPSIWNECSERTSDTLYVAYVLRKACWC
jgi:hypothetical protein